MAGPRPLGRGAAATPSRPSRRARAPVNYTEDAEDDSDAPVASNELEYDSDLLFPPSEDDAPAPKPQRKRPSPTRKVRLAKRRQTTAPKAKPRKRSNSISSLESDSNTESDSNLAPIRRVPQKKPERKRLPHVSDSHGPETPPKKIKDLAMFKSPIIDPMMHSMNKIPAWNSLPELIIKNIMSFIGAPVLDERTFEATHNFRWLLSASKVCRAWNEAALSTLWQDPVLVPMERAHLLCKILERDPKTTVYNYRQKIQHISIDVHQSASYTLSGVGKLNLAELVYNCPRLSTLEICHNKDFAPYRYLDELLKWTYPPELFGALAENVSGRPTRLKSWRWSSRLVSKTLITSDYNFTLLNTVHITPSFQSLEKLAFVNYQTPDLPRRRPPGFVMPETEQHLADTIMLLPNLKHLVFEACGVVNGILLPLLPNNLENLEIIACGEFGSDDLAEFLLMSGRKMRNLRLDHNQALSLSWLTVLREACPKLEHLRCNLAYYNQHGTYKDNEPAFDQLLGLDEMPTWPTTLRSLELTQLRKWEAPAAENLFKSILNAAGNLKDLRTLIIKAILDSISWRDRGGFRDRWTHAMERIFKRHSPGPVPYLSSLGAHQYYLSRQARWEREKAQEPILISRHVDISEDRVTGERRYETHMEESPLSLIIRLPPHITKPSFPHFTHWDANGIPLPEKAGRWKGRVIGRRFRECRWLEEMDKQGEKIRHVDTGVDVDGKFEEAEGRDRRALRRVVGGHCGDEDSDEDRSDTAVVKRKRQAAEEDSCDEPRVRKVKRRPAIEDDSDNDAVAKTDVDGKCERFQPADEDPSSHEPITMRGKRRPAMEDSDDEPKISKVVEKKRRRVVEEDDEAPIAKKGRQAARGNSDDQPIAKKTRGAIAAARIRKTQMEVLIHGHSTITPDGTRNGASRARRRSSKVDISYHIDGSISTEQVIQGMCNVVELRIDNLRPTENQYTEADFLDDEPEGDGEWNGVDADEDDYY